MIVRPTTTERENVMATEQTMNRKALHAYLSDDAHEAWHEFAAAQGVSVSGVIEALGAEFATGGRSIPLRQIVADARKVDATRRRRLGINQKG
jgi:hypothetical protein